MPRAAHQAILLRRLINKRHEAFHPDVGQVDHIGIGDLLVVLTGDLLPEIVVRRQLGQLAQRKATDAGLRPFKIDCETMFDTSNQPKIATVLFRSG